MSDSTVRAALEAALKPLVPAEWRIVPNIRNLDNLAAVTVRFTATGFTPLPEAPRGHLLNDITVTVIDPQADLPRAEDALDESVLALVTALDQMSGLLWTSAKKTQVDEKYLAWDITVQVLSRKAPAQPAPAVPEEE